MFVTRLYLKSIAAHIRRFVYFGLSMTLLCILAGSLGRYFLYSSAVEQLHILIVDEDNSMESNLFFNVISSNESYQLAMTFEQVDYEQAVQAVQANTATAAFIIPKGFTEDVKSGVNPPYRVLLSDNQPMHAMVIEFFSDSFAQMLKAAQIATYSTLRLAGEVGGAEVRAEVFMPINLKFISFVLGREVLLEPQQVSITNSLSVYEYYFFSVFFLVCMLSSILFVDIIHKNSAYTVQTLVRMGRSCLFYHTSLLAALTVAFFLLQVGLLAVIFALTRAVSLQITWSACVLLACAIVSLYTACLTVLAAFVGQNQLVSCGFLTVLAFASFLLGGGLLPVSFFPAGIKALAAFDVNFFLINLLGNHITPVDGLKALLPLVLVYLLSLRAVGRLLPHKATGHARVA